MQNERGEIALHMAASWGHPVILSLLLQMKASPDTKAHDSATALHIASHKGGTLSMRLLLEYGTDPNAKDNRGNTALHKVYSNQSGNSRSIIEV